MLKRFHFSADFAVIICVVAVAMCLGGTLARQYTGEGATPRNGAKPGQILPDFSNYQWNSHPKTLVLALRVGCPYCEASMDFYQDLHRRLPKDSHMIAIFQETGDLPKQDLPASLRDVEVLTGIDLGTLGIFGTPTIILADTGGVVQKVWRGRLSEELEQQVRVASSAAR